MKMKNKALIGLLVLVMVVMAGCSGGEAPSNNTSNNNTSEEVKSQYPTGDVTIMVPYPAGGVADIIARQIATMGKDHLGQNAVVVNRPGAAGTLAATEYLQEKADTNKLLFGSRSIFVTVPLVQDTQFTIDDIEPVIGIENVDFILYTNPEKFDSLESLIEYGKTNTIKYGSAGPGSDLHLIQAGLFALADVQAEAVVFGGGAEAVNNVAAGHIDVAVGPYGAGKTLVAEGKVVPIAVAGPEAYTGFEGMTVPSLIEQGYELNYPGLNFLAVRAGTDAANIQFLHDQIAKIYETEEFKQVVKNTNLDLAPMNPEEVKQYLQEQQATAEKLQALIDKK